MLNCREVSDHASDYLDAALPWRMRMQMWMHLAMCRFCRAYLRQMALVSRVLSRLPPQRPEHPVPAVLLTEFRAAHRTRVPGDA